MAKIIKPKKEVRRIPIDEWLAEGKRLFGEDFDDWQFKCPMCGNVQSIGQFRALKARGFDVSPDTARFSCIGRFDPGLDKCGTMKQKKPTQPCDYTLGGLFVFADTLVIDKEGKEHPTFEFAPKTEAKEETR